MTGGVALSSRGAAFASPVFGLEPSQSACSRPSSSLPRRAPLSPAPGRSGVPRWTMAAGPGANRRGAFQLLLGACVVGMSAGPSGPALAKESTAVAEAKSGGIAGSAVAFTKQAILHPIDTIKVRIQQAKEDPSKPQWTRQELFKSLYKGFLVPVTFHTPAGGVFFAAKDAVKSELKPKIGNAMSTVVAIFIAQFPYWIVRQPSEIIKVRSQVEKAVEGGRMAAIRQELSELDIRKPDRLKGLFLGYWSNIAYAFPADATKFVTYDVLKPYFPKKDPLISAALGSIASAVAQIATTPLDVGRNRIMSSSKDGSTAYKDDIVGACRKILAEEGVSGLFLGITPRIGRAIVSGAIQFATYEIVKK